LAPPLPPPLPPGSSARTEAGVENSGQKGQMTSSGHKRPWTATLRRPSTSAAAPPDPLRDLAAVLASRDSASGCNNLWVVVCPGYETVNQLAVGDLVTVIGEAYWTRCGGCDDDDDDAPSGVTLLPEAVRQVLRHSRARPISAEQKPMEEGEQKEVSEYLNESSSTKAGRSVMHVQARILQPSNGMNAALFVQALKARRQLLAGSCATERTIR
jgi:hypothetical protein